MKRQKFCSAVLIALLASLVFGTLAVAKTPFVEFGVVRQKCSVCHRLDNQGRVEVIEETRKTPEEWFNVVARMRRINGAPIEDHEVKTVVKELCQHLVYTPAEMKEVAYYNSDENSNFRERSSLMKTDTEKRIFQACVRCHAYGKILSHKKTAAQWVENMNMHLGYYPTVVPQLREMDWPKEAMDLAKVLADMRPMDTPEFKAWMAARKPQDLSGKWKIAGYQPGAGYYEGTYTFKADAKAGEDEYLIEREVQYENGNSLKQAGQGTLYGEYHLRVALAPNQLTSRVEGVFDLDAATKGFQGRWWTVVQDTNAYGDEAFFKSDAPARVFAVFPKAVKSGAPQTVTMIGVNIPAGAAVTFADANVKAAVKKADANKLVVEVTASAGAAIGPTAVQVKGAACDKSLIVYNKMDGISILPKLGRARISGGAAYPPEGVQYVAFGLHYGKDGKAETQDDLILDPVAAQWWLEEHTPKDADGKPYSENDDDLKYLAAPIDNGLYTPRGSFAPVETRAQRMGPVGLIAVGASYKEGGQEFKDRVLLGVTDPDFVPHIK
jgi:quinohemoprotein amine dehydrogenase